MKNICSQCLQPIAGNSGGNDWLLPGTDGEIEWHRYCPITSLEGESYLKWMGRGGEDWSTPVYHSPMDELSLMNYIATHDIEWDWEAA